MPPRWGYLAHQPNWKRYLGHNCLKQSAFYSACEPMAQLIQCSSIWLVKVCVFSLLSTGLLVLLQVALCTCEATNPSDMAYICRCGGWDSSTEWSVGLGLSVICYRVWRNEHRSDRFHVKFLKHHPPLWTVLCQLRLNSLLAIASCLPTQA